MAFSLNNEKINSLCSNLNEVIVFTKSLLGKLEITTREVFFNIRKLK